MLHRHCAGKIAQESLTLALIFAVWTGYLATPAFASSVKTPRGVGIGKRASTPASSSNSNRSAAVTSRLASAPETRPNRVRVNEPYGKLPMSFEANQGQTDDQIKFLSHGNGYGLSLSATEAIFFLSRRAPEKSGKPSPPLRRGSLSSRGESPFIMRMRLVGANPDAQVEGLDRLNGISNYFIGNHPAEWRTEIQNYGRVRVRNIYPGIDIVYYGHGRQLEYDLIVAPGADPNLIRLEFKGARGLRVGREGELLIKSGGGQLLMRRPSIYQESDGQKSSLRGAFVRVGKRRVGFRVEAYDRSKPLVIDPALTLTYSTFLGGSAQDIGIGIAVDADGNAYVTGLTYSTDFPTRNPEQATLSGGGAPFAFDVFVTKLSADGSSLVYSTYLGGSDNTEEGRSIAVDPSGNAYVMGLTKSNNFPTTANALQTTGQSNVLQNFVTKLSPAGSSLLYSTYLGTSGTALNGVTVGGIAADSSGHAYVTGTTLSASFPVKNAFQPALVNGNQAAFITKLDTNASGANSLVYSSYLGGRSFSYGYSIAADRSGNAYVAGLTASPDFPTRNAFQPSIGVGGLVQVDAFLTKIDTQAAGSNSLLYSTYLGGGAAEIEAYVAADEAGHAYVGGGTGSTNFPTKNPFQPANRGTINAFATKLDTTMSGADSLIYSTYLGGSGSDTAKGVAFDSAGDIYLAGTTTSTNFPQVTPLQLANPDNRSFVAQLNDSGSDIVYATYFSGSINALALDSRKNAYVTGDTGNADFPTTTGAFQTQFGGNDDAFISKLSFTEATGLTISSSTPNRGGDTGFVSPMIKGTGFMPGATVKLTMAGQPDIAGNPVSVRGDGRAITATFDLHGVTQGLWDVSVTNPGGPTVTLAQGFTVEAGSAPGVWVDLVGRSAIRAGQEEGFVIFYGNSGNTDAEGVPLTISGIPLNADVRLDFNLKPTPLPAEYEQYRSDDVSPVIETDTEKVIPLFIGVVPAGSTRAFRIILNGHGQSLTQFTISATAGDPFFGSPIKPTPEDCLKKVAIQILKETATRLIKKFIPGADCLDAEAQALIKISQATVEAASTSGTGGLDPAGGVSASSKMLAAGLKVAIKCAEQAAGIIVPELGVTIFILETIPKIYTYYKLIDTCSGAIFGGAAGSAGGRVSSLLVSYVKSGDPNDKVGTRGAGPPRYLAGDQPLRYAIFFENLATATAPAQTVVINDQLDPAKVDLSTLSLGPIAFGSQVVSPSAGLSEFSADVDLRPGNNIITRVNAALDLKTGLLKWQFQSIDPATGQPTTDPLAGFLPPNQQPPAGEGDVVFSVMPRSDLVSGAQIQNQATIVFDNNDPIDTPTWKNTIDKTKPTSAVMPLAAQQAATNFTVQWSGSDADSGIEGFNIYVSEDGGPYSVWLRNATGNSATFIGQPDKTYSFYSLAQDNAQNLEDAKTMAEATTTTTPSASQFSAASYDVLENAGFASITVTRMGNTSNGATVDYATSDGTAVNGRDYNKVSGTLVFPAGQTSQAFSVPIINNSVVDGERTLSLTLGNPTGGDVVSSPSTAALNILDDDMFGDTPTGSPVTVQLGNVTVTFFQVSTVGSTAAEPVDPRAQGPAPGGDTITGPAYDISTNATFTGMAQVCIKLDGINDATTFSHLKILHSENGALVDRTAGQSFSNRMLCASVNSLSPFVIAQGMSPTAAPASISGTVTSNEGTPIGGVTLQLSGTETGRTITDSQGRYSFEDLGTNGIYTLAPSRANYLFSPSSRALSLVGNHTEADFTGSPLAETANPLDTPEFFVRQQYLDFLVREPDQAGFEYWTAQITQCGTDVQCTRNQRNAVSDAFFFEREFQQTGAYVYRLYRAAYGNSQPTAPAGPDPHPGDPANVMPVPGYAAFATDRARVVGGPNLAMAPLELANDFVARPEFLARYPASLKGPDFVDAVLATIKNDLGVDLASQRNALIALLSSGGRGAVIYRLADDNPQTNPIDNRALIDAEYNRAFVATQYFGYLRRDVDLDGFRFWFDQVNRFPVRNVEIQHAMVCSFITSVEYQRRFSSVATHTNAECPQ